MTLLSGGKIYVKLFDFVKMSVELDTRHNPFSHFLPQLYPTIYHHNSPLQWCKTKKFPLRGVIEGFFLLYRFSS